jgi:hypothetical protein
MEVGVGLFMNFDGKQKSQASGCVPPFDTHRQFLLLAKIPFVVEEGAIE